MRHFTKKAVVAAVVLCVGGGAVAWYLHSSNGRNLSFSTALVKRGDLLATISATGTVEPEEVIDVGAQVAGKINAFGKDKNGKPIDYGSVVGEGTVLAEIDDSLYTADVALAAAQLQQAKAGVQRAEADLKQLNAKLYQATRDWARARELGPSEALAETSYDAYKSAYETAQANVAVGMAEIAHSKNAVAEAQATYTRAQQNLSYCTIKSPVKGVIIDRRVNIGQTVVSSLNAPSLFLIAKDLKRMQVWVAVNEADIGNIYPGQPASFTVDAYPGQVFRGEVGKVRLNATMTQNVVTYTVEVTTDNSSGKLLPYLTANVQFDLSSRNDVLLVPNAALRWFPQPEQVASEFREVTDSSLHRGGEGGDDRQSAEMPPQAGAKSREGIVWVQKGNYVRPIKVRVGLSDGMMTEVTGDELKEGLEAIVGEEHQVVDTTAKNPFIPQFRRTTSTSARQ